MTAPPEDLLSAYLDGELTPAERATVDAQLEESAEWRSVLVELRETRELLRGLPMRDAPAGFWDGLLESDVDADEASPVVSLDAARRSRRSKVIAWVAGGAAAAAIAAVVLVPTKTTVKPPVATMVNTHAARSSVSEEPVSELATVATPVKVGR